MPALLAALDTFAEVLRASEREASSSDTRDAYAAAGAQSTRLRTLLAAEDPEAVHVFSSLARFVDDCLPWTDAVVGAWDRVRKHWHERPNAG